MGHCTIIQDDIGIANLNSFCYRCYYYDEETGLYYLQSRYYDPEVGRFINADAYLGSTKDIISNNIFAYCTNNSVCFVDRTGCFGVSIFILTGLFFVLPLVLTSSSSYQNKPGYIKYNVPLYSQGSTSLCWAYCQTMVESYKNNTVLTASKADKRAKEIAIARHGSKNWNKGGWPFNKGNSISSSKISNIHSLYDILINNGPVYGYYNGNGAAHLVVVTGVNTNNNKVYTNNPWGVKGTQTFKNFKKGVATKNGKTSTAMPFYSLYLINWSKT